jgi:hypothetical protein
VIWRDGKIVRLTAAEALPKELQFALANCVLDRLAAEGPPPVSEQHKAEFLRREEAFFLTYIRVKLGSPFARNCSESEPSPHCY